MSFLGGFASALGRVLPGYVNGYRMAISDNWGDLNNYNKVQAGQLENMFNEQTMPYRMSIAQDAALNSQLGYENNYNNYQLSLARLPGMLNIARGFSGASEVLGKNLGEMMMSKSDWLNQFWRDPQAIARGFGSDGSWSLLPAVGGLEGSMFGGMR